MKNKKIDYIIEEGFYVYLRQGNKIIRKDIFEYLDSIGQNNKIKEK